MPDSMPLSLVIAWAISFCSIQGLHENVISLRLEFRPVPNFLLLSHGLCGIVFTCLLGYYFMQVAWYWPFALVVIGALAGSILYNFLRRNVSPFILPFTFLFTWPAGAIWAFLIIHELHS